MTIEKIDTKELGRIVLQLVQNGLTFKAYPHEHDENYWTIELLGGW